MRYSESPHYTNLKKLIFYFLVTLISLSLINSILIIRDILELQKVKAEPYTPKTYKVLSYSSSKEQIKKAVIEEFGHEMALIVNCESGFKLKAHNPYNKNGTTDSGLFQINSTHRKNAKRMGIDLDTIQGQFYYAKYLVNKNGYRDWVCAKKLGIVK
jgi:hypothetical protein